MLDELRAKLAKEAEICRATENAAFRFCPAYRLAGFRRKSPCDHCRKEAAAVIAAFCGDLPAGPIHTSEIKEVMRSINNKP